MTNEEVVINGVGFKETIDDFECLSDEWNNEEFCTMTRIRYYAEHYKEENTKLKVEIEQLKENYDTLAKQYSNVENSSIRYYNELKQLKATISKMETTTAQEDDLK